MISFLLFAVRGALRGLVRNPLMTIVATATMSLLLVLVAGFYVLNVGLEAGLRYVESKVQVVADLNDGVTEKQIAPLVERIAGRDGVIEAVYVSPDEALERFRAYLARSGTSDLTGYLPANPLSGSIEVRLVDPSTYGPIDELLRADKHVARVTNVGPLVETLATVTHTLRTIGVFVLGTVGLVSLFIIMNTIRLAVAARRREIGIMRLVGASRAYIRWPFIIEGAVIGLAGATVALAILAAAAGPAADLLAGFFRAMPVAVGSIGHDVLRLVVGAGVLFGTLGSALAVGAYLRD